MDPTIPDFIPSFAGDSAVSIGDRRGRKNGAFPTSPSMNLANLEHAKPAEASTNNGNHVRSHSVPSGPASSQRGARSSAPRGRGSLRGRGGRGGASGIPVHQSHSAAKPSSPPPVSLDSVQDFPALGGKSSESSTSASPTTDKQASTSSSPVHEKETMSKSQSMSFARIVAPAPPPEHHPQPASNATATAHSLPGASFAAAARSASAPSTNTSSKPSSVTTSSSAGSSENNASSPPSSHSPEPHEVNQAHSSSQATPIARKGSKKGHRQPHQPSHNPPFHPRHGYPQQPYQDPIPPPAPVLSATQIAFLRANGLSVEGLPAAAAASNVASTSDSQSGQFAASQYSYQQAAEGTNGPLRSATEKHFAQHSQHPPQQQHTTKHARKLSRREYERQMQMQDYYASWNQPNQYNPEYQSPFYENGQAPNGQQHADSAHGVEDAATPMKRSLSLGSSHLSVAAPSFVPSSAIHDSHLHADAKPFEPSFMKSPRLNGDAGSFVPALPSPAEDNVKEEASAANGHAEREEVVHPEEQPSDVGLSGEDAITQAPLNEGEVQGTKEDKQEVEILPVVQSDKVEEQKDEEPAAQSNGEPEGDVQADEAGGSTSLISDLASKAKEAVEGVVDAVRENIPSEISDAAEAVQDGANEAPSTNDAAQSEDGVTSAIVAEDDASVEAEDQKEPLSAEAFQEIADSAPTAAGDDLLQQEVKTLVDDEAIESAEPEAQTSQDEHYRTSPAHPSVPLKDVTKDEPWPEQYGGDDGAFKEPVIPEPSSEPEQADQLEKGQKSPPHSSFSLLPAPSVDEVLEKAKGLFGIETAESQDEAVEPATEADQNAAVDDTTVRQENSEKNEAAESAPTTEEVKANLDELDLGEADEGETDVALPTISTTEAPESSLEAELPQPSHSQQSSGSQMTGSLGETDLSQHSLSPSEVETALLSPGGLDDYAEALEEEIARAAKQTAEPEDDRNEQNLASDNLQASDAPQQDNIPFEIISSSDNRCVMENEPATSAEQDSDNSRPVARAPEVSASESPQSQITLQSQNASTEVKPSPVSGTGARSSITSSDNDLQASSAEEPEDGRSARSSAPSPPPTRSFLPTLDIQQAAATARLQQYEIPPRLHRMPSQAEKEEAIRLVAELRSEPSTPAAVDSDYPEISTVGQHSGSATPNNNGFSFDIADKLKELTSSKRKREKKDAEREDNDDHPKRKRDDESDEEGDDGKKPSQGGAPSLTLSIFSGSILPRKQLILSIFASFGINLLLPFVNGVMLGFGEIFARDWLGPFFGFTQRNTTAGSANRTSTFSTSGLGLRSAGKRRGGAQDVPGHAAAKTAIETVAEGAVAGGPVT